MATAIGSANIGKGTVPEAIASIFPLGSIFYPTDTIDIDDSIFEKSTFKKMKQEILESLKLTSKKIGEIIFEDIPIPERFEREQVFKKWEEMINQIYNDLIAKVNKQDIVLTNEDKLLIENLRIIRKIEEAINDNQRELVVEYIENYQALVNDSFKLIKKALYSIRRKYSKIFFESKLKPEFMTYISNTINTMISYFYYLNSELNNVLAIFRQLLHGRSKIDIIKKKTKAVFARISNLDQIQLLLLIQLAKLQLYMDIWSSKTIDDLFKPKVKYDNKSIDNAHFDKILNELTKTSKELHYKIIETTHEGEKEIPFTFSSNIDKKDKEKMHLISRIIHNV